MGNILYIDTIATVVVQYVDTIATIAMLHMRPIMNYLFVMNGLKLKHNSLAQV